MQPDLHPKLAELIGVDSHIPPEVLQKINQLVIDEEAKASQLEGQVKLRTDQLIASTSNAYSFLDSLHMGFILCDVNGEVVVINQPMRDILASADSNTQTWTIDAVDALMQPDTPLKEFVGQTLKTSQTVERKEVSVGAHVLHLFITPMINTVGQGQTEQIGAVILAEDITEQKIIERSKDEFFSIASHELRTPLTAIRGNTSMIKKYYAKQVEGTDLMQMVDDIHDSSVRLIAIVNDFLDASALEQGKMRMTIEGFHINEIVADVGRELHAVLESKQIGLILDKSLATLPPVNADKMRTKQVVYNLIGNAAKFTENGTITLSGKTENGEVTIFVTDTGSGMSPENQQLLFRKFQQAGDNLLTRDATKGTGLGLYISKLIVEYSGGSMWLERSEVGQGSTFAFKLPKAS